MHWRRKWQPTPVFLPGIPGMGEPGGLPSMGLHRVGHDWSDLAAAAHPYMTTGKIHSLDLSYIIVQRSSFSKKCACLLCDSLPVVILRNYHCSCSAAQVCPTLFDPMDCSVPGFPVLHHFLELAQTHISWIHAKIMIQYDLWYLQRWWYKPLQGGLCYQKFQINLNVQNGSDLKNHSMFYPWHTLGKVILKIFCGNRFIIYF